MPTFYNFRENGVDYSFDDIFVTADLFREGSLLTWGYGDAGTLGNADITNRSTPVTTFSGGVNWKQISSGTSHTSAIKTDGTLWTWGRGSYGRLGTNDTTNRSTPVTTFAGGSDWKQVSAGLFHTAAIKTDGTLWVWGRGSNGQLGDNNNLLTTSTPVTTFAGGTNWKQVSGGNTHTAAIKTDGTLWTWGAASIGNLGTNDTTPDRSTPVTTFSGGTNWAQVSAGDLTAAIKTDGTLWTWGRASGGQLGTNDITPNRSTPVTTFAGGTNWKQVSADGAGALIAAIKTDGTLWTWGNNSNGQLGTNDITPNRSTPVTTFAGGTNWRQVSGGGYHTSAIKTDGTLWTWGYGNQGQLGNNSTSNVSTPVTTFAGGTNWRQVSSESNRTAALTYSDPVL